MRWIRNFVALATALALALPVDAVAKKKGHHGKRGKHAGRARVHLVERTPPRDLARLVAAGPRLPDGARLASAEPRALPVARIASPQAVPTSTASDPWVAQRRRDAVEDYLSRHAPPSP